RAAPSHPPAGERSGSSYASPPPPADRLPPLRKGGRGGSFSILDHKRATLPARLPPFVRGGSGGVSSSNRFPLARAIHAHVNKPPNHSNFPRISILDHQ